MKLPDLNCAWNCVCNRRCGRMGRMSVHCTCACTSASIFHPLRLWSFVNNYYFGSHVIFFVVCFRLYSWGWYSGVARLEYVCVYVCVVVIMSARHTRWVCHCFCFSILAGHLRIDIYISRYLWSSESRIDLRPLLSLWGMKWHWMTSKCKSRVYIAAVLTPCESVFLIQSSFVCNCTVRCYIHKSHPVSKARSW